MPALSLAALQFMLVEARNAVHASLVVVEGAALSSLPEWVGLARVSVHFLSAMSKCAVVVRASAVDVEFAEICDVELLFLVLLDGW